MTPPRPRRTRRAAAARSAAAALALAALAACKATTEACAPAARLDGTWRYSGAQDAPARTTLSGTLSVSKQTCNDFEGTLDLLEVTAQGASRRLAGPVSGRVIDARSARFDAFVDGGTRQHIGAFGGDSVSGTWLELAGSGAAVTGTFRGRREVAP